MAWRDQYHYRGWLWAHAADAVFQCEVSDFTYISPGTARGIASIEVNNVPSIGALSAVKPNMMVVVGTSAGADDYGRARVRGTDTGTDLIYVWVSQNLKDGELYISGTVYVTVYDDRRMWMKPPYADGSGNYYYDGDAGPQGVTYEQKPIANCGVSGYIGFCSSSGIVTVSLSAATSFAVADDAVLGAYTADQAPTYLAAYANAVDGNTATYYETAVLGGGGAYMTWDYGAANDQAVRQLVITGFGNQSPYLFFLQWSDDNSTFYNAFEGTETGWGASEQRTFDVHYVKPHRYWRLWIAAVEAGALSTCRIREIEVYSENRAGGTSPWAWDVGDGTITSGTSTSQSITATFPEGHRFIELSVTDTNGEEGIKEIPIVALIAPGTPQEVSKSGATFSASTGTAGNAFDDNNGTFWVSTVGDLPTVWLRIQYTGAQTIEQYELNVASGFGALPTDWTIRGSNNGVDWTTLDTRASQTLLTGSVNEFTMQSTGAYIYYEIFVTASTGTQVVINEFNLLAPSAGTAGLISNFEVASQGMTEDGRGQVMEFVVHEDLPESTYLDGCRVMYFEQEYYDMVEGSLSAAGVSGFTHIKFNGWIDEEPTDTESSDEGLLNTTTLRCVDAGGRLQQLIDFSLVSARDAAPANVFEAKHPNLDVLVYTILRWLTTGAEICEYIPSFTADQYNYGILAAQGGNIYEMIDQKARAIGHDFVCTKHNHLNVIPNPLLCDPDFDGKITTLETLTAADYVSINHVHSRTSRTHWAYGSGVGFLAFDADSGSFTAYPEFEIAPGLVPGQGVGGVNYDDMLINLPFGVFVSAFEGIYRVGRMYSQGNAENSTFAIVLVHAGDTGIDPACGKWLKVTLPASIAAQRGLTLTTQEGIIRRVDITHDHLAMTKTIVLEWEMQEPTVAAKGYLPT